MGLSEWDKEMIEAKCLPSPPCPHVACAHKEALLQQAVKDVALLVSPLGPVEPLVDIEARMKLFLKAARELGYE